MALPALTLQICPSTVHFSNSKTTAQLPPCLTGTILCTDGLFWCPKTFDFCCYSLYGPGPVLLFICQCILWALLVVGASRNKDASCKNLVHLAINKSQRGLLKLWYITDFPQALMPCPLTLVMLSTVPAPHHFLSPCRLYFLYSAAFSFSRKPSSHSATWVNPRYGSLGNNRGSPSFR